MNNLEIAIGEIIKTHRKRREITQEQLAEYLSISFQSVSKWECGDAYPDITMLPKIALFFGITTDELLCIDKVKEQEDINEYLQRKKEHLSVGHTKEAVSEMRNASAKFPGNYTIMYVLANTLWFDTVASKDAEYKQSASREIISIGEKIRAECRDDNVRQDIIEMMTYAYQTLGENEKAVKLINDSLSRLWVSRERMLELVLEGDELTVQRQTNLLQLTELLAWEMWYLSENFAPKDRLSVLENAVTLFSMIFNGDNYGYYHTKIQPFHIAAMRICIDLGYTEKALENLKSAAEHALAFDNLNSMTPYKSPLIDKVVFPGLATSQKGNDAYNLMTQLDNEWCDAVRHEKVFIELYDRLKSCAKEDL